jgi:putative acetyltransferase
VNSLASRGTVDSVTIQVRPHRAVEWPQVRALIDRAFAPATNAGLLAEWLPDRGDCLSLVAELNGVLVGHVMLSPLPLRCQSGDVVDVLYLSPLSVDEPACGRGVARTLVAAGLAAAARRAEPLVVLEGDPAMYAKFGFRPGSGLGIERPSELIPDAAFQVVTLPKYRPDRRGRLQYPQYFYDIDAVGP